jgi:hypothetical protein
MNYTLTRLAIVAITVPVAIMPVIAAKGPLRIDGFYCCSVATSIGPTTSYLRFYPDHVVLVTTSLGNAGDVAKWLNRKKKANFHYTLSGSTIRFEEKRDSLSYIYSGTARGDTMNLRVDGYNRGNPMGYVERTYKFLHVDLHP